MRAVQYHAGLPGVLCCPSMRTMQGRVLPRYSVHAQPGPVRQLLHHRGLLLLLECHCLLGLPVGLRAEQLADLLEVQSVRG